MGLWSQAALGTQKEQTQPRAWRWGCRDLTGGQGPDITEPCVAQVQTRVPHVANQIETPESLHFLAGPGKQHANARIIKFFLLFIGKYIFMKDQRKYT